MVNNLHLFSLVIPDDILLFAVSNLVGLVLYVVYINLAEFGTRF